MPTKRNVYLNMKTLAEARQIVEEASARVFIFRYTLRLVGIL